ncbi:bifunctional PIG-L family deacetylase/class I SAM-dependent methyltransferase [Herbiconiux sp. CPCC 205716]|uniref:Bifunctional PIG-L family deacetylase/class I SAM-dependent methyltransferase n=1 Tax=Herbiconiux gentiana TaxID=2970912 RepID=A0ABT2GH18_9MICO|nr:bifunctional PIG-L family deacetylase/class I SAM-dependent methyltransferase [Herbiconiux gentiana]MCS5715520.1 bifunctional PIG-L family deacetylase/class I SAM-dependent methyltransferase [Herbiconiux gentiana]
MTGYTHHDDGTAEERWAEAFAARGGALREIGVGELAELGHLVVVAAHPDDETLGAAGLLARAYAAGVRTTVLVATSGEASHPGSTTHRPSELARLREAETAAAVAAVDPGATVAFLRAPDGRLGEAPHREALTEALLAAVRGSGAGPAGVASAADGAGSAAAPLEGSGPGGAPVASTWFVAPWGGDRHPDHEAAAEAVADAVRQLADEPGGSRIRSLAYPVWLWHWGAPDGAEVPWDALVRVPLDDETLAAKRAALAVHRSQVEPLSDRAGDEVLLHPGMLAHFERPFELFVEVPAELPAGLPAEPEPQHENHTAARYFDALHESAADPWGFESRWYEQRKRAILLASLPDRRYREVLEVGTSTGVLSRELAGRASVRFVGVDVSEVALARARNRNADLPQASFERMTVPADWPAGTFDLVVVSEVGYYLDPASLTDLFDRIATALAPDGALVLCHWRHTIVDRALTGDDVHAVLERRPDFVRLARHLEEDFVLDVVVRPPAVSIAAREGLA